VITDKGKTIIGKYMLGQAPAYASYIAVGCGPTPLDIEDTPGNFSTQESLDFEMFRVPISSRGFVNENGINKIVLTAELPTEERYEITEVGIFSAGSNPSAGAYDSKNIFAFTSTENWQYHTASSAVAIPPIVEALDPEDDNIIATNNAVFQSNADNSIFYKPSRVNRYERARFLNNTIFIRGDDSDLTISEDIGPTEDHFVIEAGSNHIHLTGSNVDFTKNSPIDELRLAFSIINKNGDSASIPDTVRILVDFSSTDAGTGEFARFEAEINQGSSGNLEDSVADFATNRYFVVTKQLQELYTSANFTWDAVTVVKIYACIIDGGSPSENYYVALDAMRLENVSTINPLYGLTGYSVIKTDNAETIIKSPNTSNYVEFRFSIGVT
jgi:hypothetical protein